MIKAFFEIAIAAICLKLALLYPVAVCTFLVISGLVYYFIYNKIFKSFMNDYLPLGRCLVDKGTEYEKYEVITRNKTFVEEYRKNQNNEFVFSSMKEVK